MQIVYAIRKRKRWMKAVLLLYAWDGCENCCPQKKGFAIGGSIMEYYVVGRKSCSIILESVIVVVMIKAIGVRVPTVVQIARSQKHTLQHAINEKICVVMILCRCWQLLLTCVMHKVMVGLFQSDHCSQTSFCSPKWYCHRISKFIRAVIIMVWLSWPESGQEENW